MSSSDFERMLLEEIWGCVKYIGLPYETVMSMPIQTRKSWIQRHNAEQEQQKKEYEKKNNGDNRTITGLQLNSYAGLEQERNKK